MLYIDASALAKRYKYEHGTDVVFDAMNGDHEWTSSPITKVETARTIAFHVPEAERASTQRQLDADWRMVYELALDDHVRDEASRIAAGRKLRPLDAIHLASITARRASDVAMLTFDDQLAAAAREHGIRVIP